MERPSKPLSGPSNHSYSSAWKFQVYFIRVSLEKSYAWAELDFWLIWGDFLVWELQQGEATLPQTPGEDSQRHQKP